MSVGVVVGAFYLKVGVNQLSDLVRLDEKAVLGRCTLRKMAPPLPPPPSSSKVCARPEGHYLLQETQHVVYF